MIDKVQQIFAAGATPGINGLIRIPHDEKILMIGTKCIHQPVLQSVNILKFIDHDVLKPLLPFCTDGLILLKNIQRELDQVIVIQPKTFLFLIEITIKNNVYRLYRLIIFPFELLKRHRDHILVVVRSLKDLEYLDAVARLPKGHIPQAQPALIVDSLEHRINICIIQNQKTLWIAHRMAVLLQYRHAEPMKGIDIARIVVTSQLMNAAAHLIGRLVGKRYAKNIAGQDAQFLDQISKPMRQCSGLARTSTGNNPHEAFRRRDRLPLRIIQSGQIINFIFHTIL